MLNVTTVRSHSHVGSQAIGEVRHRLVDVFLWQLFPTRLRQAGSRVTFCSKLKTHFFNLSYNA